MSEGDTPPQAASMIDAMRIGLEAERSKIAEDRIRIAEDRIRLADAETAAHARTAPPKPSWYVDWVKPTAVIPLGIFAIAAFMTYQHDQAALAKSMSDLAGNVATIASRLDRDEQDTKQRLIDFVPVIRKNEADAAAGALLNKSQDDRMNNLAHGLEDLRTSVEKLRDMQQQDHTQIMIEESRRQRQGMLAGPHGAHAPTPEDDALAR